MYIAQICKKRYNRQTAGIHQTYTQNHFCMILNLYSTNLSSKLPHFKKYGKSRFQLQIVLSQFKQIQDIKISKFQDCIGNTFKHEIFREHSYINTIVLLLNQSLNFITLQNSFSITLCTIKIHKVYTMHKPALCKTCQVQLLFIPHYPNLTQQQQVLDCLNFIYYIFSIYSYFQVQKTLQICMLYMRTQSSIIQFPPKKAFTNGAFTKQLIKIEDLQSKQQNQTQNYQCSMLYIYLQFSLFKVLKMTNAYFKMNIISRLFQQIFFLVQR
eukprot:TRINITY_DN2112_c0_g3_i2.p2 TRINITY_DN2112_c0_g3~~TRINITY_DN2112_c0_g3_i2.p2  ORF type:complete len:269 (+),score=-22.64 TRINITY_DN2112_c0_g3_i2:546-1352(+)